MGVNSTRVKYLMDTAAAVTLRDYDDGAETSTATETAVSLSELDGAYWQDGKEIPNGTIAVQVFITACDFTTGDETYVLDLLVDDTSDMSNTPVSVAKVTVPGGTTGPIVMLVDAKSIPTLDTDSSGADKWIAIKATLGGTSPSITYGAWMAKDLGA